MARLQEKKRLMICWTQIYRQCVDYTYKTKHVICLHISSQFGTNNVYVLWCKEGYTMKYSVSPRGIRRAKLQGFTEGLGYISLYFPTWVTLQTFSITTPALTFLGDQYCKSWFSVLFQQLGNTGKYCPVDCIRIRTRGGIYGQIYPFAWRSSRGRSQRELLKAKGYIWPYNPSWALIRTVYYFNNHKANNSLISLVNN